MASASDSLPCIASVKFKVKSRSSTCGEKAEVEKETLKGVLGLMRRFVKEAPACLAQRNCRGYVPLTMALRLCEPYPIVEVIFNSDPAQAKVVTNESVSALACAVMHKGSPLPFISALIDAWPAAAALQDGEGATPLHRAIDRNAPLEVVELLLLAAPKVVGVADKRGRTPVDLARDETVLVRLRAFAADAAGRGLP